MKTLYLECETGISGDMIVGMLLDLGADQEVLKKTLSKIEDDSFKIEIKRVNKSGIDCCDFNVILDVEYDPISKILKIERNPKEKIGKIAVCCAGTADIPVAEEASQTAEYFGSNVERFYDVGISGLHRLLSKIEFIQKANCVIAIAGMEGALASVIGGMVSNPVIAVPTSIGYGASFGGLSALLTMLNSCANGVSVVNIDNGYGAGYIATQINRLAEKK